MPSKRQVREAEEEQQRIQLEALQIESEESENEVDQSSSIFAVLSQNNDVIESEEEEVIVSTVKKSKSKKKSKAKKTAATPGNDKKVAEDDGMDEIDRALAELASKPSPISIPVATPPVSSADSALKKLFSFEAKFLDANAELRKFFGSKIISSTTTATSSPHHPRFSNNVHHKSSQKKQSTFLAQPESGWYPLAAGASITLAKYAGPESKAEGDWFTFIHSQQYKESQLGFLEVLQQADGNRLFHVLESNPYQVDTLMQISEMNVQQGDQGAATTYLAKALYALSSPLPPTFNSGSFRLPYSQIENRSFYLAIARNIGSLSKKGCYRTAFEWSKIILGCSGGIEDPVGALLWVDFLAVKANQNSFLLQLLELLPGTEKYPGLAYAKALCLRNLEIENKESDEKSTAALSSAILRFPMIALQLLNVLGGKIPPQLLSNRRAQVDGVFSKQPSYLLSLLSEIFVNRNSVLFKEPSLLEFLKRVVATVSPLLDDGSNLDVIKGEEYWSQGLYKAGFAPAGIIRAATLSDIPSVKPYLPRTNENTYSFDPVPPPKSATATFYDDSYFASIYGTGTRREIRRPDPNAAGMMEQLGRLLGLGGDGGAIDINPELRAQLLEELDELRRAPGDFPVDEENNGEVGLIARLAAMFGGRPAN